MDIVKSIKDYAKSTKEQLFQEFLEETLESCSCAEDVKNSVGLLNQAKPLHDFVIFSNEPSHVYAKRLK